MNAPAYDLGPLAHIAVLGVVLASGPLLWLALRQRRAAPAERLRALTLLALFFCFDLVLVGAYTRLSDSGLGCPDWPGCYGSASPIGASEEIHAAQSTQPTGPVTPAKAWVEMLHRYLATGVGVLIAALAATSWVLRARHRAEIARAVPIWATATLVWVCVQGAFGALTVTWKLYPAIVTAHLLGGMALLALLAGQAQAAAPAPLAPTRGLRVGMLALVALVAVQIALGGWVSTNYAVLACRDFPTCQGAWWPPMDFEHGYALLRPLGEGKDGGWLPFAALTAIHVTHRLFALPVLVALLWVGARVRRVPGAHGLALALLGLALWQFASGLSNVVLGWPLVAALSHTGGAAVLVVVLTRLGVRMRQARTVAAQARFLPASPVAAPAHTAGHWHHV